MDFKVGDKVKVVKKGKDNESRYFNGMNGVIHSLEPILVDGFDTSGMYTIKADHYTAFGYFVNMYPSELIKAN